MSQYCIILTTCPDSEEANQLASKLIEQKLAACVQLSQIKSYYYWDNSTHADPEIKLLIKTRSTLYETVEKFIKKHHSYEVPQIVQIPVMKGYEEYLDWIDENTTDV